MNIVHWKLLNVNILHKYTNIRHYLIILISINFIYIANFYLQLQHYLFTVHEQDTTLQCNLDNTTEHNGKWRQQVIIVQLFLQVIKFRLFYFYRSPKYRHFDPHRPTGWR